MIIDLNKAVQLLASGEVIACPTESVYGLSCDASNPDAVSRLIQLKCRDCSKGFIIIVGDFDMLNDLVDDLSSGQIDVLKKNWPGPVTFLMPFANTLSHKLTGDFDTQAIRMSSHPVLSTLVKTFGKPIVSTSANISSETPAKSIAECEKTFGAEFPVLAGDLGGSDKPTAIVDLLSMDKIR